VVSSFQKARNCSTWNAREDIGEKQGFFENRSKKTGLQNGVKRVFIGKEGCDSRGVGQAAGGRFLRKCGRVDFGQNWSEAKKDKQGLLEG
jgi:hypothetical protein